MELYKHQKEALDETEELDHVAYYHDMGLGKTFTGAEKMVRLGARVNLVICQKSKVDDWIEHFYNHYYDYLVYDGTKKECLQRFFDYPYNEKQVLVINYELAFRRPELLDLIDFTLMLDESSMIQNDTAKRTKFILKLKPKNVILLSGTPTGGKYENLYSQLKLLGWPISKKLYWQQFIKVEYLDGVAKYSIPIVKGYKNVDRLKKKMYDYGCRFLKTDEVFDLPIQNFQKIKIKDTNLYRKFKKWKIVYVGEKELVGDTTLKRMLYERMLCGAYSEVKLAALKELLESSDDRFIIFYNFNNELVNLQEICDELNKPISIINGEIKSLDNFENESNSVTLVQYQAGAMGLNLQKANKIIYFTPTLSSELYEQSKKRIHRIGQNKPCFYYNLIVKNSIEQKIYQALEQKKNYTEALFEKEGD